MSFEERTLDLPTSASPFGGALALLWRETRRRVFGAAFSLGIESAREDGWLAVPPSFCLF